MNNKGQINYTTEQINEYLEFIKNNTAWINAINNGNVDFVGGDSTSFSEEDNSNEE